MLKTEFFAVRMTKETKEKLRELAWRHQMSMSDYVTMLIEKQSFPRGRPRKG